MSFEFIWQLPTSGDGRLGNATQHRRGERMADDRPALTAGVSDPRGTRFNFFDHIHQIARAADLSGFDGVQIQHDLNGDESWIVAGYIARSTKHVKLLIEFDAAWGSSVYAAKNAVSFQRYTGGRLAWQLSISNNVAQRRQLGDFISDVDIVPRIEEFVTVARGVIGTSPFSYQGRFFEVLNGGFNGPLANQPIPPIYLSGATTETFALSAKLADVHVLDVAPIEKLAPAITQLRNLAAAHNRRLEIGLRIDVLARDNEDEALRDASRYLAQLNRLERVEPIVPYLYGNFSTERTGAAATLIGSYTQVIEQLVAYADAGITRFILAAIPHFEEAYRIGEHVLPVLRERLGSGRSRAA